MMSKRVKKILLYFCVIVSAFLFFTWQNNDIVVSKYTYEVKEADRALSGYKILHISDLHNKEFGHRQQRLLNRVAEEAPDMIVITGDLVDSNRPDIDKAMTFIEGAVKLAPVYYVTGNHENWLSEKEQAALFSGLESLGVICLNNKAIELSVAETSFWLLGLKEENLTDGTLKELAGNEKGLQLLLAHEPQYLEHYTACGVDVVFAGHAHGGQFRLPGIGGLIAPGQGLFPTYTEGMYREKNTCMYVSRGLGNSVIPIRIFNRPELVVLELVGDF